VQLPSRARLLRELLDTYDILNEVLDLVFFQIYIVFCS
jgi:hypothetical protein